MMIKRSLLFLSLFVIAHRGGCDDAKQGNLRKHQDARKLFGDKNGRNGFINLRDIADRQDNNGTDIATLAPSPSPTPFPTPSPTPSPTPAPTEPVLSCPSSVSSGFRNNFGVIPCDYNSQCAGFPTNGDGVPCCRQPECICGIRSPGRCVTFDFPPTEEPTPGVTVFPSSAPSESTARGDNSTADVPLDPTAAPVTPAPVTSAPITSAPVTDAPITSAPVTDPPITSAPVTPAPVTDAPITSAPVTDAPITSAPVTDAPITSAPVTSPITPSPVTAPPVTDAPITASPVTDAPITGAPVTEAPITASPVTEAPITASPVTDAPITASPVTDAPVTEAPITASPVTLSPTTSPIGPTPSPTDARICPTPFSQGFRDMFGVIPCDYNSECADFPTNGDGEPCCAFPTCICGIKAEGRCVTVDDVPSASPSQEQRDDGSGTGVDVPGLTAEPTPPPNGLTCPTDVSPGYWENALVSNDVFIPCLSNSDCTDYNNGLDREGCCLHPQCICGSKLVNTTGAAVQCLSY